MTSIKAGCMGAASLCRVSEGLEEIDRNRALVARAHRLTEARATVLSVMRTRRSARTLVHNTRLFAFGKTGVGKCLLLAVRQLCADRLIELHANATLVIATRLIAREERGGSADSDDEYNRCEACFEKCLHESFANLKVWQAMAYSTRVQYEVSQ